MDIVDRLNQAKSTIDEALRLLTPSVPTVLVRQGDNLLSILEQAIAGTIVTIEPTFSAFLGYWSITKPVTITSSVDPGPGRVSPQSPLPTLVGLLDIQAPQVTLDAVRTVGHTADGTLITAFKGTLLNRVLALGSPMGQHRGVLANAEDVMVVDAHIGNIWKDIDTQAVACWQFTKRLRIVNAFLEASGENFIAGGADAPSESDIPTDISIVGSTLYKPVSWRGKLGLTAKNLLELKNVRKFLMKDCILENSWQNGQEGYAIVLHVRNQDGTNPWATVEDVLIEDVVSRHLGGGISLSGHDDGGKLSGTMRDVTLRHCQFEDIDPVRYGGSGRQLIIQNGGKNLTFEDSQWSGQNLNTALTFGIPSYKVEGFRYVRNKAMEGQYGIHGEGAAGLGKAVLDFYCPSGYEWSGNMLVRGADDVITYPAGTTMVTA